MLGFSLLSCFKSKQYDYYEFSSLPKLYKHMNFSACVKGLFIWPPLTYKLLIAMKLAVLLTLVAVLEATAGSFAQRITLRAQNIPLAKALDEVHIQSGYQIFLNGKSQSQTKVNVFLENASLEETMNALLKGLPLHWKIKDNTIIIRFNAS